jgi:hypothetical protein
MGFRFTTDATGQVIGVEESTIGGERLTGRRIPD